jgi:hypothetical protein
MLRISWSGLRTHLECKQRGALHRSGRSLKLSDSRSFFPGIVTDKVVREWLENSPERNFGAMPGMVEQTINVELERIRERGGVVRWKHTEDQASVLADCIEAVKGIEPALIEHVLPNDYMVDFRFQAPLGIPGLDDELTYITLVGAMDIITRTPEGEFAVWDVKHTRDGSYWKKTVGQLSFYDLSVFALFEKDTTNVGLLQPLCLQQVLPYSLDDSRRSMLMQQVIEMAHDIWRGDDQPTTDTSACFFCDVKHACSKFQPIPGLKDRRVALI